MKNSLFIILSLVTLPSMCFRCENDANKWEKGDFFNVKNSYVQKIIPGTPNEAIVYEIGTELDGELKELLFDSLYYKNKICRNIQLHNFKLVAKLREGSSLGIQELDGFQNKEDAILFYSSGQSRYYCILTGMRMKEPLYLP